MDRQTERWTDGRTDNAGRRVACTRLKEYVVEIYVGGMKVDEEEGPFEMVF